MANRGNATDPIVLAETFADIARALLAERNVEETLHHIVEETLRLIGPAEHCGIDVVKGNRVEALVPSSEIARRIDAIQVEVDEGPCLSALRNHEAYVTGNLPGESRWPRFATRAHQETGILSIMGFRLWVEEDTVGALDIYSTQPDAFDDSSRAIGSVMAAHAAIAWSTARKQEQLEEALRTRDLIGQAKGMLMREQRIDEDRAFELLQEVSQRTNTKLRDIAQRFVEQGGTLPD